MKMFYRTLLMFVVFALTLSVPVFSGNGSYLDTIYQASDEGAANFDDQCTPGVDCPDEQQCTGDDCAAPGCEGDECGQTCEGDDCQQTCEGDDCGQTCEGDDCDTCQPGSCPDGQECADGKCVPTPENRIKSMLERLENVLNRLISRLMNRLLGINVHIKVVEAKKVVPRPKPEPDKPTEPEPPAEPEKPAEPPAKPPAEPPTKPAEPEEPAEPEPEPPAEPEEPADPEPANEYRELTNFEEAKKLAKEKGHPIMMVFSGFDWCGWCKKFKSEIMSQPAFQNYAKDNMETFVADFPRNSPQPADLERQNQALMQEYGVTGFPTVLVVDADGKVIRKTGYIAGGAENYVNHIKSIIE